jgi:type VII secretion protein EccB
VAAERSTKAQVQAYLYGVRRVEHAVLSGASFRRSLHSPRPGLSVTVGAVLAAIVLGGFAVYGFVKPAPSIGDAKVLVDSDSGGAFVMRDGTAYPAMNLASALLATAGEQGAGSVRRVTTSTLAGVPKGQLLGIPEAPNQVPTKDRLVADTWTVCDVLTADPDAVPGVRPRPTTTVLIGLPPDRTAPEKSTAVLVTADGSTYYLVWGGRRAKVDLGERPVIEGLGLDRATARRVSVGFLNAIPEGRPIARPTIPGSGEAAKLGSQDVRVGDVVAVRRASGAGSGARYLVLDDGVQEVPGTLADIVRAATPGSAEVREVPLADLSSAPLSRTPLDVDAYPAEPLQVVAPDQAPGVCLDWRPGAEPVRTVYPVARVPLPAGAKAVPAPPLPPSSLQDGTGAADSVYLPPGKGLVVSQSLDGRGGTGGALVLVNDQGIRYPVVDAAALASLGLADTARPAPAELISLLPLGPTLDPAPARKFLGGQDGLPAA